MSSYHKLLLSVIICILISFVSGVTIELIHRDSPLSPSYDPSQTRFQRLRNAIYRSLLRKSSLSLTSSNMTLDKALEAPLAGAGGEYLIEYHIGTPPVRQLSIVDTGSDLTWIQCKPCTSCYVQNYTLFDPAATKTYRPVACRTNLCAYEGNSGCNSKEECVYQVVYGDRSFSKGDLATDTLTLGSTLTLPNFGFGCGRNNNGTFTPVGSGIFGLGTGAISIVRQQSSSIHGRFSYCLTYIDSNVTSKISFGNDALVKGPNVLSTPLLTKEINTFYYLKLEGISVGKQRFKYYNSEQFDDEGNIIIDSGTTLTFIPLELYQVVESALRSGIKATPVKDPHGTFNLCYKSQNGGEFNSPVVTAHFKGANVALAPRSIFVEVEEWLVCLTFLPSQDLAIFGNLHQSGYLIGYDLLSKQISFLQTDCI
ncbi:hypothetical protein ACS0TY_036927 [Phlomoides rotata]